MSTMFETATEKIWNWINITNSNKLFSNKSSLKTNKFQEISNALFQTLQVLHVQRHSPWKRLALEHVQLSKWYVSWLHPDIHTNWCHTQCWQHFQCDPFQMFQNNKSKPAKIGHTTSSSYRRVELLVENLKLTIEKKKTKSTKKCSLSTLLWSRNTFFIYKKNQIITSSMSYIETDMKMAF